MPHRTKAVVLAADADGRQIVSIHAKRTYAFDAGGTCRPAEEQVSLFLPRADPVAPWHAEVDIIPIKRTTDIIVHAVAYGGGTRSCLASIAVAGRRATYRVFGDRRCSYGGPGSISFSEAECFDAIPICYERAYGGVDDAEPVPAATTIAEYFQRPPGVYPRNSLGRGYVVRERREALEGLLLPNVERPEDLLTPENIVVGEPTLWWRQPLPWSCEWFRQSWYPRSSFFGGGPHDLPVDDADMAEVRLGWVQAGQRARAQRMTLENAVDGRFFDAASPPLVVPFVRPDERIELTSMTRAGRLVVQLPGDRPQMEVRFEGGTYGVVPVPNRVVLSVEEERLSVVWHGAWLTPRELPDRFPEEGDDENAELEGIEVFIDGAFVAPGVET